MVRIGVRGLTFAYNGADVLKDVNLDLAGGNLVGLVGPNGSGKSTLLKCLDRLLVPRKGKVLLDGKDLSRMGRKGIARRIGYVPQSTSILFPKTVFDTVLMGRIPHGNWSPTRGDLRIATRILRDMGMGNLAGRDLNSLSGGQRQKVMIARALAQKPEVLLLDEPTSSLDLANQIDVMELIIRQKRKGIVAVMAVHDLNLALRYCDSFILLKGGRVVAGGDSESLSREVLEEVYDIRARIIGKGKDKVLLPVSRR